MASVHLCFLKSREPSHFPLRNDFADLPQSSVSCQVPKRDGDGASPSFKCHDGRWLLWFPDSPLFSFLRFPQDKDLAKPINLVHCSLPDSTGQANNTWACYWIQEPSWLFENLLYKDQNFWIKDGNPREGKHAVSISRFWDCSKGKDSYTQKGRSFQ